MQSVWSDPAPPLASIVTDPHHRGRLTFAVLGSEVCDVAA